MTEGEIMKALASRYAAPAWAFLPQVRNGTGFLRVTRTADALALGLWPSRGMELHGFEVKASRSDWIRELKEPAKADEIFRFCDRWWVVVGDDKIVQSGELPPTWGLLAPRGSGLTAKTEAPKLDAQPLSKAFVAAICRRLAEVYVPLDDVNERIDKARESERDAQATAIRIAKEEMATYKREVADFEQASGVKIIDRWSYGNIGRAVRDSIERGPERIRRDVTSFLNHARRITEDCERYLREEAPEVYGAGARPTDGGAPAPPTVGRAGEDGRGA